VAVGAAVAERLGAPMEPLFVRKLPIPSSPEMGFGAVAIDGAVTLNEQVVAAFGISRPTVDATVAEVLEEVRRRAREYAGIDEPPDVNSRNVYLLDDGLATGFTALAGLEMIRRRKAARSTLCVPCSPLRSVRAVRPHCDELFCLFAQTGSPFAVASYYEEFPDMTDDEVRAILARVRGL
jgi:putative phosphoribosyl transferase